LLLNFAVDDYLLYTVLSTSRTVVLLTCNEDDMPVFGTTTIIYVHDRVLFFIILLYEPYRV